MVITSSEFEGILMIQVAELENLAGLRLADAQALLIANRLDGAAYLAGYVVELALKAQICKTLNWPGFPETRSEFQNFQSFRTHNLAVLLKLSGVEADITLSYASDWPIVVNWNPEIRYRKEGAVGQLDTENFVRAAQLLLGALT